MSATYYSLGGPTLAHRLVDELGLDPATDKYHLVGVGCASAVPLFRLAAQGLRDHPGRKALVVAAESVSGFLTACRPGTGRRRWWARHCSATAVQPRCWAAPKATDGEGPAIVATAVHQVAGTLGHVRFGVTGEDSHMRIARELPAVAEEGARPLVERFLRQHGLARADVDHWLVHPGGRGIIEASSAAWGLPTSRSRRASGCCRSSGTSARRRASSFSPRRSRSAARCPATSA